MTTHEVIHGVYCIHNLVDGKMYIGMSYGRFGILGKQGRLDSHLKLLRLGIHYNCYLQRAWNKYGEDNFEMVILEKLPKDRRICADREISLIAKYNTTNKDHGYNLTPGGDGISCHSLETRLKMSDTRKGRKQSPESIAKRAASNTGKKRSEETKARMSASQIGHTVSDESKAKMSKNRKGIKRSPEAIEKQAATLRGRPRSPEARAAISAGSKGKKLSAEHIAKMIASKRGKKLTKEHKENIRLGNLRRYGNL